MKLLLTSDLHGRIDWYRFLAEQKPDALLIAGDLLDAFHPHGIWPQLITLSQWFSNYDGVLALCSGNHDANTQESTLDPVEFFRLPPSRRNELMSMFTAEHWMDSLERPQLLTDRRSQLVKTTTGSLVITTLPFSFLSSPDPSAPALLAEGARLRCENGAPWIVLHHEPPAETKVGGIYGDRWILNRIEEYQPDFVVSGHHHAQPYLGEFADKVGSTWCFNPGYPEEPVALSSPLPNHILLDLTLNTAAWRAAGYEGPINRTIQLT